MALSNHPPIDLFHDFFSQNDTHAYALFDAIVADCVPIDYCCIFINQKFEKITGLVNHDVLGRSIDGVMPHWGDKLKRIYHDVVVRRISQHFQFFSIEMRKHFDIWVFSPRAGRIGTVIYDMTEKYAFQKRLEYVYYHDPLTDLMNKQYVKDKIAKCFAKITKSVVLISIDINALRKINDVFGYDFGDEVLRWTATAMKLACKAGMIPFRWGNDNFLVIAYGANAEKAEHLIQDIEYQLSQNKVKEAVYLSITMGYYVHTDTTETIFQAIAQAERAMAENKFLGMGEKSNVPIEMVVTIFHEKNCREAAHSKRVSELCAMMGKAMGMSRKEIDKLRLIGLVHDIGKLGIDEAILNKNGKLTDEEYQQIKKHPEIGFRILTTSPDTTEIAYFILSHHERFDGLGYPNGIKGNDIPLFSKILSVADSFDAMTRERTYKLTMSTVEAVEELRRCAAKQFDPIVVECFAKLMDGVSAPADSLNE